MSALKLTEQLSAGVGRQVPDSAGLYQFPSMVWFDTLPSGFDVFKERRLHAITWQNQARGPGKSGWIIRRFRKACKGGAQRSRRLGDCSTGFMNIPYGGHADS